MWTFVSDLGHETSGYVAVEGSVSGEGTTPAALLIKFQTFGRDGDSQIFYCEFQQIFFTSN